MTWRCNIHGSTQDDDALCDHCALEAALEAGEAVNARDPTTCSVCAHVTMELRAAETMADAVQAAVSRGQLDARSPAADALLDYRDPHPEPYDRKRRAYSAADLEDALVSLLEAVDDRFHLGLRRADATCEELIDAALGRTTQTG